MQPLKIRRTFQVLVSLVLLAWTSTAFAHEPPAAKKSWKSFPAVELSHPETVWKGEPITLSLKNADLVEVLRSFAKLVDVNFFIDPKVQGRVTVELKEVPWDQALYVILKTQGLGVEISGNIWLFDSRQALAKSRP
jgi:type II secretory pathway component HofQ